MDTYDKLQELKKEAIEKETKEREDRRKVLEERINRRVENLIKIIVEYFLKERIAKYSFVINMGIYSSDSDDNSIVAVEFLKVLNDVDSSREETEYFQKNLNDGLKQYGILFSVKYKCRGFMSEKYVINFEII